MRITFICGSLEEGRDGVGDYTRRLAAELTKSGHQTCVIALYDDFISEIVEGEQHCDGVPVQILRIPHSFAAQQRLRYAKKCVGLFSPEWLSLQFVLYAYNLKGLPFKLPKLLFEIGKGKKWHIMFHELWVGMEVGSPVKYKGLAFIQKIIIRSIIKTLQPAVIHTHAKVYQVQLNKEGYFCDILPLFSNIPINKGFIATKNEQTKVKERAISMVIFGHIQHGAPIRSFAEEVLLYERELNVKTILSIIGVNGSELSYWENVWKEFGLEIKLMGKQPFAVISDVLQEAFIGISTTPALLTEKSGTIAAMQEHGLKIICVSREWRVSDICDITIPDGIIEYKVGNFKECMNKQLNTPVGSRLPTISAKLASDLFAKNKNKKFGT